MVRRCAYALLYMAMFCVVADSAFAQWRVPFRNASGTVTIAVPSKPLPLRPIGIQTQSISNESVLVTSAINEIAHSVLELPQRALLTLSGSATVGITTEYAYQAEYDSIPIQDRYLDVTVGRLNNSIIAVRNAVPAYLPNYPEPSLTLEEVYHITDLYLGTGFRVTASPVLTYVVNAERKELRLAYELSARDNEQGSWRMTIDAVTGEVIEKRSKIIYHHETNTQTLSPIEVYSKVHLHSPFDTLTSVSLPFAKLKTTKDSIFYTDSIGSALGVFPINAVASLNGRYSGVIRQDGASASVLTSFDYLTPSLTFDDNNSVSPERDAYYSVNFARSFIHSLDPIFPELDRFTPINVNLNTTCNAYYDPDSLSLNFFRAGGGCTNTAEISDVVYHEYGHRVQHAVFTTVLGKGKNISNSALGEGFSDVYSALMRDDPRIGVQLYGNTDQILRSCENTKQFPQDINGDTHLSGLIISGAFWDLRKMIGLEITTKLFHQMMYHHPDGADAFTAPGLRDAFVATLMATVISDDDDNDLTNGTPHYQQIIDAFKKHNITIESLFSITLEQLADQDTADHPYVVKITPSYHGLFGVLDTTKVFLYYSIDGAKHFSNVPSSRIDGTNTFQAAIPRQTPGTVVYYYASAQLNISNDNDAVSAPNPRYVFLVGDVRLSYDDCEINRGFKTTLPDDDASSGRWELADPYSTHNDIRTPLYCIQQDTDHTEAGTMCYVTGNGNLALNTHSVFEDVVYRGKTTLVTPVYTFHNPRNPVIRYWYYYSNDRGSAPSVAEWVVKLSVDNGVSWKTVTQTTDHTDGWRQALIEISAYGEVTTTAQLQFIASNYVNATVEAGIDDIETFDANISSVGVAPSLQSRSSDIPYPNPVAVGSVLSVSYDAALDLYDLSGKLIVHSKRSQLQIPSSLAEGVYVLRTLGNETQTYKIIVTK